MFHLLAPHIFMARGGGGGSGGHGGGGHGSGGGGFIVVLGYLPTHLVGAFFRKKLYNPLGLTLTLIITLTYGVLWWFVGSIGIIVSLAAFVGGPAGYFDWFGKVSKGVKNRAQTQIAQAAQTDPAWDETALKQRVHDVFMSYQQDWSTFNLKNVTTYTTPEYARHTALMLEALRLRQRRNQVDDPTLLDWYPTAVDDLPGNAQDRVTFFINAKANDKLIESIDGNEELLFEDKSDFGEYWQFVRSNNTWLLADISQSTENKLMLRPDIKALADQNGFYYSPDWGWLLLPRRGQLFKNGKFGTSDINNHVIGMYHDLLIELYTYIPRPNSNSSNTSQYVIAQAALPKRYEDIIVQAKKDYFVSLFNSAPHGYNKLKMEWPDFNKRYDVYATNVEQVTAFELLHPVYMEKLFALPFRVSIEVVDNVVYLYTTDNNANYDTMFGLLQNAFKEMRL